MRTRFLTSFTVHVSSDEINRRCPLNGSVFMARVDVAGTPVSRFAVSDGGGRRA